MVEKIERIIKRDGTIVPFSPEKITNAIRKAVIAVGGTELEAGPKYLTEKTLERLRGTLIKGEITSVEDVQDVVEKTLIEEGKAQVAKAYIVYRLSHQNLRDQKLIIDTIDKIQGYLDKEDWMIKSNANMTFSLQGLNNHLVEEQSKNYWLHRVYPEKIRRAHERADIHIHDLGVIGAYCVGWDLEDILTVGINGVETKVEGKVESGPAKHLDSALGQVVNFFYTLQGETAGAQALSSFDTYLAPFIRKDNLTYEQVRHIIQSFLFNANVPTRVGFQTPFTNVTMDLKIPNHMKDKPIIIGGKWGEETYGDFQKEEDMFNKAFAEGMLQGDHRGRLFTFPIPTYNITKDFDWDDEKLEAVWEMTAKYGIPYFSNFVNSDMKPEDARSMCCRLRLDNTELRKRGGGLFGSNPLTGSIGVVTINLPRIGFRAQGNEEVFFKELEELADLSKESLQIKRKTIEGLTNQDLYPYAKFYLRNVKQRFNEYWKNHFSTIGILGMNEAVANFMPGEDITTERGRQFALKTMDFLREKLANYQKETGEMYNLEATPGESTTYRFASEDKKRFQGITFANNDAVKKGAAPFYTNSTHLPVGFTEDIFEALTLQDEFQTKYTGGTVLHGFVGERMTGEGVKTLVRKISNNFRLPYFTITPTFSVCGEHGYMEGEKELCPKCEEEGKTTHPEVYSRVVGYIRPVKNWNDGKQSEWNERRTFEV